jgi:hypothetical protein
MQNMVKTVTWVLGIVLVLIGVAGYFTDGMLLVFQVDAIHNAIHLLSGVVAIGAVMAGTSYARLYLIAFGVVYGLVAVLGFATGNIVGIFSVNEADNYLHAAIALVCLGTGFGAGTKS